MLDRKKSFSLPNTRQSQGGLSQFSTIIILRSIAKSFVQLQESSLFNMLWIFSASCNKLHERNLFTTRVYIVGHI